MSDIMTPAQVAKRLQVTERTVYKYLSSGEMEAVKIGRIWRITEEQLQKFIQKNTRNKGEK